MAREQQSTVRWNRMGFGMVLAAVAGAVFGHAWTVSGPGWWWAGTMTLLCGALLILSSLYARDQRPKIVSALPLGQVLVKKGLITEGQLGEALARHHRDGRPIGQILVEMRLITPVQLSHALGDQQPSAEDLSAYATAPTVIATTAREKVRA
ncbi:MAG: hypothetical protein ABSD48_07400 [Armatimonadota bacterium]